MLLFPEGGLVWNIPYFTTRNFNAQGPHLTGKTEKMATKKSLSGTQEFGNFAKTGNFLIPDIGREISLSFS